MKKVNRSGRMHWLSDMIRKGHFIVGAEIGVNIGLTSKVILEEHPRLILFAVDNWGAMENDGSINSKSKRRYVEFLRNINSFKHRVSVLEGTSWEMADHVADNSLDFIFIDACHQHDEVKKDIRAWTPKLRKGGLISGHDTHFDGVVKALNDLIPNWEDAKVDHVWYALKEDVKL